MDMYFYAIYIIIKTDSALHAHGHFIVKRIKSSASLLAHNRITAIYAFHLFYMVIYKRIC